MVVVFGGHDAVVVFFEFAVVMFDGVGDSGMGHFGAGEVLDRTDLEFEGSGGTEEGGGGKECQGSFEHWDWVVREMKGGYLSCRF